MEDETELDTVIDLPHSDWINNSNPPVRIRIKSYVEFSNSIYLMVLNDEGQDVAGIALNYNDGQIHVHAFDEQTLDRNDALPIEQWQESASLALVENVGTATKRVVLVGDLRMDELIEPSPDVRTMRKGTSFFDHVDRFKLGSFEAASNKLQSDNATVAARLGLDRTVLYHSMKLARNRIRHKSNQ